MDLTCSCVDHNWLQLRPPGLAVLVVLGDVT